jgi:hypothetical protein
VPGARTAACSCPARSCRARRKRTSSPCPSNFTKLGVNLRPAVNIPVNALVKIAVADIVQAYRPQFEKWPGLIIDVTEEHVADALSH